MDLKNNEKNKVQSVFKFMSWKEGFLDWSIVWRELQQTGQKEN